MLTDSNTMASPVLPPPRSETGVVGRMHANLFNSRFNSAMTVLAVIVIALALWFGLGWILVDADWTVISTLGGRMIIGQYNIEAACPRQNCFWRPQAGLLLVTLVLGMAWQVAGLDVRRLLLANLPALVVGWSLARYTKLGTASWTAILSVTAFVLTLVLLRGIPGVPFLQPVSVIFWGGIMLNLMLAVAGIGLSFPIGIALALGRRSELQVVKLLSIVFFETFRGVPLITLLFMSLVLVPLAFPEDFPQNSLMRAAIVITLFSSAYMAENIRGGLQSLHPGQAEAARALGLPGWQTMLFISLPQAIRNVIPPIVGQFISLFKDTSLVYIIGMLDVVELSRAFIQGNPEFLANAKELFIFLALVFWVFTYGMSYVSRRVEQHLGVGER